jgi:hypothetical protein
VTVKPLNLPGRPPTVTVPSGAEFTRLSDLIARQRRELDRMQSGAAGRSVVDLARGMLMERLRCSPAEAQAQLAHLSAESGMSLAELAAQTPGRSRRSRGPYMIPAEQDRPDALKPRCPARTGSPGGGRRGGGARRRRGIAAAVLEEALAPTGAVAVAPWPPSPTAAGTAYQAGFSARDASRWRRIHPDMDTPCSESRTRAPSTAAYWAARTPRRGPAGWATGRRARAVRCPAGNRARRDGDLPARAAGGVP